MSAESWSPGGAAAPADDGSPLSRTVLREQVTDLLLNRILDGEYEPGDRLVETRIARELGISQAPVREALRDLEQLGCIVHEPYRGCSVRRFSVEDLLEAFPVRSALEELAAGWAAERITDEELKRLESCIEGMREAGKAGDAHTASRADVSFHSTIVEASRNHVLAAQWRQLQPYPRTFLSVTLPEQDLLVLADRHVPILDALREGEPAAAAESMRVHLQEAADKLRPLIHAGDREEDQ
jgi:DNA-binding GntR family transcriptional regulator